MKYENDPNTVPDGLADKNGSPECDVAIRCRYVLKEHTFSARILSYHEDGLYFESDTPVAENGLIFYELQDIRRWFSEQKRYEGLRTASLAKVLSCRETEKDGSRRFGATVMYYRNY